MFALPENACVSISGKLARDIVKLHSFVLMVSPKGQVGDIIIVAIILPRRCGSFGAREDLAKKAAFLLPAGSFDHYASFRLLWVLCVACSARFRFPMRKRERMPT